MIKKNTLSLITITKNSEKTLSKSIESVKNIVDEIIIVDTGSEDKTLEIAKKYKAKLFKEKWEDNFSKAINSSIEKASSEWLLLIASDEYISKETSSKIIDTISNKKSEKVGVYLLNQTSNHEDKKDTIIISQRLFRNLPKIRFKYAIHEYIPENNILEYKLTTKHLDLIISHSGYETEKLYRKKEKRNLKIMKKQLLKDNLDNEAFFHYGVYYLRTSINSTRKNNFEKTVGKELVKIKKTINNKTDLFIFYSIIQNYFYKYNSNLQINFEELFIEARNTFPLSPYIAYKYAELFFKINRVDKSIQLLESCLNLANKSYNKEQVIDPGILNYLTYFGLLKCYSKLNQTDKMIEIINIIKKINLSFYESNIQKQYSKYIN